MSNYLGWGFGGVVFALLAYLTTILLVRLEPYLTTLSDEMRLAAVWLLGGLFFLAACKATGELLLKLSAWIRRTATKE